MFYHALDSQAALSLLEHRHAEELFALIEANRERLARWLPWTDATCSVADVTAFIQQALRQFANDNGFHAALWDGGRIAGVIGYHGIDWTHRSTSLGYWLGASFEGRGLMTHACKALVDHAFGSWQLNRVEIRCATGNVKSRGIPKRLGFEHEGTAREAERVGDRYLDLEVYSMLASEWRSSFA